MNEELTIRMVEALEGIRGELREIHSTLDKLEQNVNKCVIRTGDTGSISVISSVLQY